MLCSIPPRSFHSLYINRLNMYNFVFGPRKGGIEVGKVDWTGWSRLLHSMESDTLNGVFNIG